ncbi:DUF922 domain-containing protein [Notoacmeibacter ruber]|uniref:DUF922 domain-containing protein n=1 Tax=Notoacmeibacter ruber TaxID=2670375 RepID=UPI001AECDEF9|nr:DUF922 domain-containing protein [Notoacmeibacter ruber]
MFVVSTLAGVATVQARVDLSESTQYYTAKGQTGKEVARHMARRGPRSGFLARAIAQTWYSPKIDGDLVLRDGVCRARDPAVKLHIRYTYPRLGPEAGPRLQKRWSAFMKGVVKHESQHAALARQMATRMDELLTGFAMRVEGRSCRAAQRELSRRLDAIWKAYDLRQNTFDRAEHRRGGEVDKLLRALVR